MMVRCGKLGSKSCGDMENKVYKIVVSCGCCYGNAAAFVVKVESDGVEW